MDPLQTNKLFTLEMGSSLSELGQEKVRAWLMKQTNMCTCSICFPSWWDWRWTTQQEDLDGRRKSIHINGETVSVPVVYRGRLLTRLAQLVNSRGYGKLTAEQRNELSNLLVKYFLEKDTYYFDFTQSFDWEAGTFGDKGSCFWGSNSGALALLERNDAYAIRFYSHPQRWRKWGVGRAWILPYKDWYILFNGYWGGSADHRVNVTHRLALVFAKFLQTPWTKIELCNQARSDSLLYINAAAGYTMHPKEDASLIPNPLDLDLPGKGIYPYTCSVCERDVQDAICIEDGREFCYNCWRENTFTCDACGRSVILDARTTLGSVNLCPSCVNKAFVCDRCGEAFMPLDVYSMGVKQSPCHTTPEGRLCDSCFDLALQRRHARTASYTRTT